jgi:hypothetical protein
MRLLLSLVLGFILVPTLTAAAARTDRGELLWEDHFDGANGEDVARAVAAGNGRVFAVGSAGEAAGNTDFVVRAYDAKTGRLLWTDRVDLGESSDGATAVVLDGDRVIVAGTGVDGTGANRLLLRAYDAKTGELEWEDRPTLATFNGLAVAGRHAVVAGTVIGPTGHGRLVVRGYIAKTGALAWQDQPSPPAGYDSFSGTGFGLASRGVVIHRRTAFVAGTVRLPSPVFDPSCLVRAYDVRNGVLEWQAIHDSPQSCEVMAIATDGKRVILAALGGFALDDFMAQSYDAETGQFLWEDRTFVGTGFGNAAVAVDIERRLAFVAGWVRWVPGRFNQEAFLVRAYDTEAGTLAWEDQYPSPQLCLCHAHDVVVEKGQVIAVGVGPGTWLVRAYDARNGSLRWSDEFAPVGATSNEFLLGGAVAVAIDSGGVFVAGSGTNASGNSDFILRAYDAK